MIHTFSLQEAKHLAFPLSSLYSVTHFLERPVLEPEIHYKMYSLSCNKNKL